MSPGFCTPGSGSKRHGLVLLTFVLSSQRTALGTMLSLGATLTTVSRIKFNAVGQSAGIAPGYLVAWASVLGTVSCHRRFGNSIGGKAHRHIPRRSQIEVSSSSNTNTSANVLLGEVQAVLQLSMQGGCLCSIHPTLVRLYACLLPSLSLP